MEIKKKGDEKHSRSSFIDLNKSKIILVLKVDCYCHDFCFIKISTIIADFIVISSFFNYRCHY